MRDPNSVEEEDSYLDPGTASREGSARPNIHQGDEAAAEQEPEIFQFNLGDLELFEDEAPGNTTEGPISDDELREWLQDHVGQDWENLYHQARKSLRSFNSTVNNIMSISILGSESLSQADIDNIAAFALRHKGRLSRRVYKMMIQAFAHRMTLEESDYLLYHRMDSLSGIECERYDMCIKSCCAFTQPELVDLEACPYCKSPRFDERGKPFQSYRVLPLAPRLLAAFANKSMAQNLMYRSTFQHKPGVIPDIFDSTHYQRLLDERVIIDG